MSFVSTAKTHRHDPNKFEFVEGGVFNPGKRYASIIVADQIKSEEEYIPTYTSLWRH